jgi:hypothetical protein
MLLTYQQMKHEANQLGIYSRRVSNVTTTAATKHPSGLLQAWNNHHSLINFKSKCIFKALVLKCVLAGVVLYTIRAFGGISGSISNAQYASAGLDRLYIVTFDDSLAIYGDTQLRAPGFTDQQTMAVAAGINFTVTLLKNGTVACFDSGGSMVSVPLQAQANVKAIASGVSHILALTQNGTVVCWGFDTSLGQCKIPFTAQTGVKDIAAGESTMHAVITLSMTCVNL